MKEREARGLAAVVFAQAVDMVTGKKKATAAEIREAVNDLRLIFAEITRETKDR